jgi:hypothetical protein
MAANDKMFPIWPLKIAFIHSEFDGKSQSRRRIETIVKLFWERPKRKVQKRVG